MIEILTQWADVRRELLGQLSKEKKLDEVNSAILALIEQDIYIIAQALSVIAEKGGNNE